MADFRPLVSTLYPTSAMSSANPWTSCLGLGLLLARALGYAGTSRAALGADADRMIAEIRDTLSPYFANGPLMEQHCTAGELFARSAPRCRSSPTSR